MRFALPYFAAALLLASPAFAQDLDALTQAEQQARAESDAAAAKAEAARKEAWELKKKLAATAKDITATERRLTEVESRESTLAARADDLAGTLADQRKNYSQLLAALQRLEADPPPAAVMTPRDAVQSAQAAILMAQLSEQLKTRAEALSRTLIDLSDTREALAKERVDLSRSQAAMDVRRARLDALLADKSKIETALSAERDAAKAEADRLAQESENLRELIASLETEAAAISPRVKPDAGRRVASLPSGLVPFTRKKDMLIRPVTGALTRKFGRGEKGLTFSGRSQGQVLAPFGGSVEFSGPFKNYGKVVILNVGDGYFLLLTGLDELFIGTGDTVRRGEPVGALPFETAPPLYLELRKDGRTLDPAPWLAGEGVKSG